MVEGPQSAADPRPDNKPYYIHQECPQCETPLVLGDTLAEPEIPPEEIFYDEWECPQCQDGIYLDWPRAELEALEK